MEWLDQVVAWVNLFQRDLYAALGGQIRAMGDGARGAPGALAFALALGAVHALTPGHGKAVVFTYFIGGEARIWSGAVMALKVAGAHVASAGALVAIFGSAVSMFGRPTGAAQWLQATSYGAITLTGAWLLYRAAREAVRGGLHEHSHSHTGLLPFAVGLLPCPMTMLVLTYATANATVVIGVVLSLFLGIGIAATIAIVGSAGILARRGLLGRVDPSARLYRRAIDFMQIASALVILVLGGVFLAGSLR